MCMFGVSLQSPGACNQKSGDFSDGSETETVPDVGCFGDLERLPEACI